MRKGPAVAPTHPFLVSPACYKQHNTDWNTGVPRPEVLTGSLAAVVIVYMLPVLACVAHGRTDCTSAP